MRRGLYVLSGIFAAVSIAILGGCSGAGHHPTNSGNETPQILKIAPSDGAALVPRSSAIIIKFSTGMDTASVRASCYLAGGASMGQWMDSLGGHMMMGNMMDMGHMMAWMDTIMTAGHFEWNAAMDSCAFQPDSMLIPNSDYMIFLYGRMSSRAGTMMNMRMGSMASNYEMHHFRTGSD